MPLYTFMVEDGYGCSIPVGHFFVANENMETIAAGFESLKKSVGVKILSQNQVFLVDKGLTEIGLVRKYFPESAIHLCLFHVFKTFRSETTKILGKNRNKITELVEKIAYCSTEETYEELYAQLLEKTTSQFGEYFKKNWHECRDMWVSAWRKKTVTFGNRTTNRLESFHHKLKEVIKSMQSVAECVRGLVRFSNRKEFEIEHRRFLSKSTVAYCASANHEESKRIYATCTPFAAGLVNESLTQMKKICGQYSCQARTDDGSFLIQHSSGHQYTVNSLMNLCTCTFATTMLLPCKHVFLTREQNCVDVFDESLIPERWRTTYQLLSLSEHLPKPTAVLTKTKQRNILSRCEKYNKVFGLLKDVASVVAEHGQAKFNGYITEIKLLKDLISSGKTVKVVEVVHVVLV
ncbi:uncharacterized protein LOC135205138 [Macrobrachium nipponense]|uniref:uncharacterized protein LOC135205138 n=1 Tax=Macrobrachium nipponense TaxID=159736 RepID=UPI0030C7B5A5